MPLHGALWDHTHGNTPSLCNMLRMRADKSGWSVGGGDILTIEDDISVNRNLITEYRRLTVGNIDAFFAIYKSKAGHQIQISA